MSTDICSSCCTSKENRGTLIIFLQMHQVKKRSAFNDLKGLIFEQLLSET